MKTVAVLIPTFSIELSTDILSGIYDYFIDKNVKVIIVQTRFSRNVDSPYDFQYWTGISYLKAHDVDAYIVASGMYTTVISKKELEEMLSVFSPRPIVSLNVDLNLPSTYSISTDCTKTYEDIVRHLKEVHGCKKIAFCSANSTGAEEALERYDAFTKALEINNLTFYPDLVIDGAFSEGRARSAFKARYKSKEDIIFDAIVCANDQMGFACLECLKELGIQVPEQVKVVGFDDALVAKISEPKLSTVYQPVYTQGYKAAEMVDKLLKGESVKKKNFVPLLQKYRQSCSCIESSNPISVYNDENGNLCEDPEAGVVLLHQYAGVMKEKNKITDLMDVIHGSNTIKQFFYNLKTIATKCDISCISLNFFKDVIFLDEGAKFKLPKQMSVEMLYDMENNIELFKPGLSFNPEEQVVASRSIQSKTGIFILHPIFLQDANYGYMLCKINKKIFSVYIIYLKMIVSALAQSYEYTNQILETQKLESEKTYLTRQSRTDELTKILNRRGFYEQGQSALDVLQETNRSGVVFFADIDDLKGINDTYGHEMGDLAIKLEAKALKSVFRNKDVVGRLSGDEFAVVAFGMKINHVENIRLKIQLMNEKLSLENNLPFTLSISLGAVDLQKSPVLKNLLAEADKSLYQEKRKKRDARLS